jgi:hypothetical protein
MTKPETAFPFVLRVWSFLLVSYCAVLVRA